MPNCKEHIEKMKDSEIETKLREIVIDICKYKLPEITIKDLTEATQLKEDLDFDSVDLVELVFRIEDTFNLSISDEESDAFFVSFGNIAGYIQNKQK